MFHKIKNKKTIIIIIASALVLLVIAPWMNNKSIQNDILQKYGRQDGSIDKNGNLFCDYESRWLPFGRWVVSCEGGYFVPFFYIKKGNKNIQEQQVFENNKAINGTANWKTYKNEEYGFEFEYPGNISFSEARGDRNPKFLVGYEKIRNKFRPEGERAEIVGVSVYDNLKDLSIEGFLIYLEENEKWRKWASPLQLNGLVAVKIDGRSEIEIETGTAYDATDIYLKNNFLIYKINYDRIVGLNELEVIFNQILSTFKFTK